MKKFSNSLVACLSHQRTLNENQRQIEIQKQLKIAREEAVEASRMKSLFFANMSHEIRTPLNAIIGFTNLLSKGSLSTEQKNYAGQICTAGNNLLQIINEILDFSKIESGTIESLKNPFDPQKVIDNLIDVLSPLAVTHNVSLKIGELSLPKENLIGDEGQLNQILINLGSNAIKFSPNGNVTINWVCRGESDTSLVNSKIWISDDGIGIKKESLANIFNAFEQVDSSATRSVGGSGLGLAITKGLLNSMNGDISVKSEPGKGSTFTINVPFENDLKKREHQGGVDHIDSNTNDSKPILNKKILIVEDNKMNQLITKAYVENSGAKADLADNGIEALDLIAKNQYELVLMDCQMPTMDGYEATIKIREKYSKTLPILALTAHAFNTDREKCLDVGMNDYLTKPISEDQLIKKIVFWLHQ